MVRFQKELEERLEAGEALTELTVDEILHKYRSAQDKFLVESFGTIAAYGPNAAMMHYHATEADHAALERKGFLLVDCGGTYMDGTTDITRTYPLGPLTEEERLCYTWTLQSHVDIAKAVWLDYCTGQMLDSIAREPLWQHLINYRCGTGTASALWATSTKAPTASTPATRWCLSRAWSSPTSPASTRAAGWASASRTSWNAAKRPSTSTAGSSASSR